MTFLLPKGPMLTKTNKIHKNVKIENFLKKEKKWCRDMVERELPTKFGLDPIVAVSEKLELMDGWTPAP